MFQADSTENLFQHRKEKLLSESDSHKTSSSESSSSSSESSDSSSDVSDSDDSDDDDEDGEEGEGRTSTHRKLMELNIEDLRQLRYEYSFFS